MPTPAVGALARMAMDSALPFDSASEPYEFVSESLRKEATIIDTSGIRGTRSRSKERTRAGTYTVGGTIVLHPSHRDMDRLLPRILGSAESSDTFALAESLPEFYVFVDRVTSGFVYEGCKVVRATFRGSEGSLLELALDVEAKREGSDSAGTFVPDVLEAAGAFAAAGIPALDTSDDSYPYVFMDGVFTLSSAARQVKSFELVVENVAATERFMNSVYRQDIPIVDRRVTLRCTTPYTSDESDLYNQALGGAAATIAFTNPVGGAVLTFSLGALQVPAMAPVVSGKGEVVLEIEAVARASGATKELVVTNVA